MNQALRKPKSGDIEAIAYRVLEDFLGIGIDKAPDDSQQLQSTSVGACIFISGAWEGGVAINCSEPLARDIAGTMFNLSADAVNQSQIEDAIGELANIIGGNIKALLPGPSRLSLPVPEASMERGGVMQSRTGLLTSDKQPLSIVIYQ